MQAQYVHPQPLSSGSQGNAQALSNGNLFVGWGAQPYFSEFNAAGQLVYDAHWHGSYQSYRSYRFQWTGAPPHGPALAVTAPSPTTADRLRELERRHPHGQLAAARRFLARTRSRR